MNYISINIHKKQSSHRRDEARYSICLPAGSNSPLIQLTTTVQCTWRRQWQPTPVLLAGKSQGRRSLVGYCPRGLEELDTTKQLHFHFSFHAVEKEMATHSSVLAWRIPGGARWAAVYGVAQSWTRLK